MSHYEAIKRGMEQHRSFASIGQELGISRERVRQLAARYELTFEARPCVVCGKDFTPGRNHVERCRVCAAKRWDALPEPKPAIPEGYARCYTCKQICPVERFYKSAKYPSGLYLNRCKDCTKTYQEANRDRLIQRAAEWQRANPERARQHSRDWLRRKKEAGASL
jgi:hypothetical protein